MLKLDCQIRYGECDREWCEYFGIGGWVDTDEPLFMMVNEQLLKIHTRPMFDWFKPVIPNWAYGV